MAKTELKKTDYWTYINQLDAGLEFGFRWLENKGISIIDNLARNEWRWASYILQGY